MLRFITATVLLLLATMSPVAEAAFSEWTTQGPYGGGVLSIALDTRSPSTLYMGTSSNGVFKSTDGGATWRAAGGAHLGFHAVRHLAIDPGNPQILYAVAGGDLYKSLDAGESWHTPQGLNGEIELRAGEKITPANWA